MTGRGKKAAAPKKKANGYKMPAPIASGEVIHDTLMKKKWRIGPSIGVGGFGEIYSACDHDASPKGSNYPFVIKIEPHENGPLFVEKHFYVRNANKDDIAKFMKSKKLTTFGMPTYFGNGSHEYKGEKYRYLVLERYDKDLWSIFLSNGRSFPVATVFQIGLQMLDVLEYIHSRGYVHADIKGANILLGLRKGTEHQAYLVDFGLATRVSDKEFKPDPKCAHNGTIEYTSRDAHLGVATMRGDLEILGYNMLQWIVGKLPWEHSLTQPKTVQAAKEAFMTNVKSNIAKLGDVPGSLVKFFEYINTLKPKDQPDYTKCRNLFESHLKTLGKTRSSKLEFTPTSKKSKTKPAPVIESDSDDESSKKPPAKRTKQPKIVLNSGSDTENETPNGVEPKPAVVRKKKTDKRKSIEPLLRVNVKKTKLAPRATPPLKKNHVNIATQTSDRKVRQSPRTHRSVTFDSPVCQNIADLKPKRNLTDSKDPSEESCNSSGDIFDDSFVIEEKKVKPKKRLIADEEVTVKRVVKKKVTTVVPKPKGRSWKDSAAIINGRPPPCN